MIGRCVANRPYMYLPLKGDTNDYSVNAQNPSNTGVATTTGIFGETDGAYNWADISDRLEWSSSVGNAVATKINNAMTLCFWSYKNFGAAEYPRYLSQFSSTTGQNAFLFRFAEDAPTYDNTIVLSSSSSGTTLTNALITNNITTYNAWEFVVNSFSDTTTDVAVQIYIDGLLKVSSNLPYAKTDSSLVMRIGATLASNIEGDVGKIADYRIYNQKLSAGSLTIINNEKGRISLPKKLLLDTYSGAAVAYSLRKLRYNYNGSAIRVRRSSDNTEQDIGFVNNQLNTSALTTFCSGTNGFVVTWYDQSGNGRNATQSTASNQPQIVSSGSVLTENSEPTLYFDGTNDCMQTSTFTTSTQPITRIILANQNTDTEGYLLDGDVGYRGVVGTNTTDQKHRLNAGTSYNYTTENDGTQILRYAIFNGSSSQLYLNGTGLGTCNPGSEGLSRVTIGSIYTLGGNFAKANMQEIIIYASDQASNKSGIESNINTYFGVY